MSSATRAERRRKEREQARESAMVSTETANHPRPTRATRRAKPGKARERVSASVRPRGLWPTAQLDGHKVGYYADPVRWDDCFRAAIATATQIPIRHVLDLRLHDRLLAGEDPDVISDESWLHIERWADGCGLQLVFHEVVPVDRERWIGVCKDTPQEGDPNPFTDHCLVMCHGRVIFDPAAKVIAPRGMRLRAWDAADVTYGISFDRKE